MQTTIKSSVSFQGVGLHGGQPVRVTVHPASAEHGTWFYRTDILDRDPLVPARWHAVSDTRLCTKIENADGVSVSTVEHLMAALAGCGIQNARIEIDGPEVPILDGSAVPFVQGFIAKGVRHLAVPVRAIEILKPVEVKVGAATARLDPADTLYIDFEIDFPDAAIGRQDKALNMANGSFVRELSDSRTFCRHSDIEAMYAQGLAKGGTYENAVVVDGADILSPGGLRHKDEAVRHKMLDALGDLALAGAPIMGRYSGFRAGHAVTNQLLRALFAQPDAYRMIVCDSTLTGRLPGVGLHKSDIPVHA